MREETKQDIVKEWIFCGLLFIVMILLGGYALVEGGKELVSGVQFAEARRATAECEKWNDWALIMPKWDEESQTGYFILPWQKEQCDSVGIDLRGHLVDYTKK